MKYVVIVAHMFEAPQVIGPFDSEDDAQKWVDRVSPVHNITCKIRPLQAP